MRINFLAGAAALAFTVSACGGGGADDAVSTDVNLAEDPGATEVLGPENGAGNMDAAALPTTGAEFAAAVAASDLYEIESATLAAEKAGSSEIKAFAAKLRTDHEKSTVDLKAAGAKASPPVTVTPQLDAEKQALLEALRTASGAEFDRLFVEQQATAHQKALKLLQNYGTAGDSEPLKAFATQAAAVVQSHVDHVNRLKQ